MKTNLLILLLLANVFTTTLFGQQAAPARITFMLKNTLGYHRMFLAEGPGIKYGFTMNKRETVPCNWPVGTKLYFSQDGETSTGLILTVTLADEGKTLMTDSGATEIIPVASSAPLVGSKPITVRLHNPSLMPRKIALISYEPGATGNSTSIMVMWPKGTSSFRFPAGTKLYLANSEQVDVVMSGKRIDNGTPFLVVKKEDQGKSFNVN